MQTQDTPRTQAPSTTGPLEDGRIGHACRECGIAVVPAKQRCSRCAKARKQAADSERVLLKRHGSQANPTPRAGQKKCPVCYRLHSGHGYCVECRPPVVAQHVPKPISLAGVCSRCRSMHVVAGVCARCGGSAIGAERTAPVAENATPRHPAPSSQLAVSGASQR